MNKAAVISQLTHGSHDQQSWLPVLELAVQEVFELMLNSPLTRLETALENPLDITSIIGLAGKLRGLLVIRCSHNAASLMASKMLGIDIDKVGAQLGDAVGEVCNMIAGNFKNKIAGLGDGCMLSVPTVIMGKDYSMHSLADSPALEVRLLFENLPIIISLQVHS